MSGANKPIKLSTQCIVRLIVVAVGIIFIIAGAVLWPKVDEEGIISMYEGIRTSVILICIGIAACFISFAGDIVQRVIEQEAAKKQSANQTSQNSNQNVNQYRNQCDVPNNNHYNQPRD